MAKSKLVNTGEAALTLPMAEPDEASYIARQSGWLQVRLDQDEAAAFRRFHAGLIRHGAKMPNGKPVTSKADAVRWLMRRLVSCPAAV